MNVRGVHGASLVFQLCLNEIEGWTKGAQQIVLVAVKGLLIAEELADDAGVFEVDSEERQVQRFVGRHFLIHKPAVKRKQALLTAGLPSLRN
jgi:uncharacterized membrane protein YdcZ (DUF606 family)